MERCAPAMVQGVEGEFVLWKEYRGLLSVHEREAFDRLARDSRTGSAEADLGAAILLAIAAHMNEQAD